MLIAHKNLEAESYKRSLGQVPLSLNSEAGF